jgi:protein-disulfide isomerase
MRLNRTAVAGAVAAIALVGLAAAGLIASRRNTAASSRAAGATGVPGAPGGPDDLLIAARTRGDTAAPIVMYEVSDFQCPFCRQFWAETLPHLEAEYIQTGKLRLTFINFPISQIHPNAEAAHELAMCGAQQGKFWWLHDLLYAHQRDWEALSDPQPYFRGLADSVGMSQASLAGCIASGRIRQLVAAEAQASFRAGVKSTPSFIVQGVLLAGAAPIEAFRPILDSIYAATVSGKGGKGGTGR